MKWRAITDPAKEYGLSGREAWRIKDKSMTDRAEKYYQPSSTTPTDRFAEQKSGELHSEKDNPQRS